MNKNNQIAATVWAFLAIFVTLAVTCGDRKPLEKEKPPVWPSEEVKNAAALLINANGMLCAKAHYMMKMSETVYSVSCTTNRDGSGISVYTIDTLTLLVKQNS